MDSSRIIITWFMKFIEVHVCERDMWENPGKKLWPLKLLSEESFYVHYWGRENLEAWWMLIRCQRQNDWIHLTVCERIYQNWPHWKRKQWDFVVGFNDWSAGWLNEVITIKKLRLCPMGQYKKLGFWGYTNHMDNLNYVLSWMRKRQR